MSGILSSNDTLQLNRMAASGIDQKLRNLRARSGVDTTLRRLLWELVQNAKDNSVISNNSCDAKVDIRIKLTEDSFVFSHNNGFFKVENIQGIIRRFSSEDKEGLETTNSDLLDCVTGRFGTGFMTTHLLSEFVTVKGLFKDPDDKFRDFDLHLDRRGKTNKELEKAINGSILEFEERIEETPFTEFKGIDSWTSFHYDLAGDGFDLANKAIDGLMESLGYVLINLPVVNSISIERNEGVSTFKLEELDQTSSDGLIIKRIHAGGEELNNHGYIQKKSETVSVTIPVRFDDTDQIIPTKIDAKQPRLFLDFPLVGSEALRLPFVINSHRFEPEESRDGVFLADSQDDATVMNKKLIEEALELYLDLVRELSSRTDTSRLHSLVAFGNAEERDWLSATWYQDDILDYGRRQLLTIPLIDTNGGERKSIQDSAQNNQVYFPYHPKEEVTKRIWKLSSDLWPNSLPCESDFLDWSKVLWEDCFRQNLKELSEDIQKKETLAKLGENLGFSEKETIRWVNDYYDLLFLEGKFVSRVKNSEFAVIPSRKGNLKEPKHLRISKKLDDPIVEVCEMVGYELTDLLVHKEAHTNDSYSEVNKQSILYPVLSLENVAAELNSEFRTGKAHGPILNFLISLFAEDDNFPLENEFIYSSSIEYLTDEIPEKTYIKNWIPEFWEFACGARLDRILREIAKCGDLEEFCLTASSRGINEPKQWLINFCKKLVELQYKIKLSDDGENIIANRNGVFKKLEELFDESENIDPVLLDIAAELGTDFREKLMDRDFSFIKIPDSRLIPVGNIADAIVKAVRELLELPDRTEETSDIFARIIDWFDGHPEQARNLFPGLYENQHTLYSPDQIKRWREGYTRNKVLSERDKRVTEIMEKHNISDFDELEKRLSQTMISNGNPEKHETRDRSDLLAAGIYSESQGENLNRHSRVLLFSKNNYSSDDYAYVKAILRRAVKNVLMYLLEDERYQFQSDIDAIMVSTETITVISGVKKNGQDINLVIRPSDGQKVHVFYGAEFQALKQENTEFWIDNGNDKPEILTIGKILEYTGTEVIPLYRIELN